MSRYAELEITTNFSFLHSASHVEEIAKTSAALGLSAISVTDRNTLAGIVRAHRAAKETGIRLVVGARLDLQNAPSLLCLPTDRNGYAHLSQLITLGRRRAPKGECEIYLEDVFAHYRGQVFISLPPDVTDKGYTTHLHHLREVFGRDLWLAARYRYNGNDATRLCELAQQSTATNIPMVATNDVSKLKKGQAQYSLICNEKGGIIDDILVYKRESGYMLVVNASDIDKKFDWLKSFQLEGSTLENRSKEFSMIAIQGPKSRKIIKKIIKDDISKLGFYQFVQKIDCLGHNILLSRTGYTGELGFEIYCSHDAVRSIWSFILDNFKSEGIKAAGLGCRDTLRLEMGYHLYGNDININTNPFMAGLGWITDLKKGEFVGRNKLRNASGALAAMKHAKGVRGRRGGVVGAPKLRRASTVSRSFWDKKSKADEARHCLMKAIKKAKKCCINFCKFLKEKPMLQNYEKCHHRSATDKFSSVLMGMQTIVLTGILLLTALEIGTQEMTDFQGAFADSDEQPKPVLSFFIGWLIVFILFIPFFFKISAVPLVADKVNPSFKSL